MQRRRFPFAAAMLVSGACALAGAPAVAADAQIQVTRQYG
jgi:Spy/CpxP family protein refolding chaperone